MSAQTGSPPPLCWGSPAQAYTTFQQLLLHPQMQNQACMQNTPQWKHFSWGNFSTSFKKHSQVQRTHFCKLSANIEREFQEKTIKYSSQSTICMPVRGPQLSGQHSQGDFHTRICPSSWSQSRHGDLPYCFFAQSPLVAMTRL